MFTLQDLKESLAGKLADQIEKSLAAEEESNEELNEVKTIASIKLDKKLSTFIPKIIKYQNAEWETTWNQKTVENDLKDVLKINFTEFCNYNVAVISSAQYNNLHKKCSFASRGTIHTIKYISYNEQLRFDVWEMCVKELTSNTKEVITYKMPKKNKVLIISKETELEPNIH